MTTTSIDYTSVKQPGRDAERRAVIGWGRDDEYGASEDVLSLLVEEAEQGRDRIAELDHTDGCKRCAEYIFGNGVSCIEHGEI